MNNIGPNRDSDFVLTSTKRIERLLLAGVRGMRCGGSCAMNMCYVASNRMGVYFEVGFGGPWDPVRWHLAPSPPYLFLPSAYGATRLLCSGANALLGCCVNSRCSCCHRTGLVITDIQLLVGGGIFEFSRCSSTSAGFAVVRAAPLSRRRPPSYIFTGGASTTAPGVGGECPPLSPSPSTPPAIVGY
jgi:hypothetical protein